MCKLLVGVLVVSTLLCPASPIRFVIHHEGSSVVNHEQEQAFKSSGDSRSVRNTSVHLINSSEHLSLVAQPASSDTVEPKMLEASSKFVSLKAVASTKIAANQTALLANETDKVVVGRDFRSTPGKHQTRRARGVSRIRDDVLLQRIGVPQAIGFQRFESLLILKGPKREKTERYMYALDQKRGFIGRGAQAVVYLGYYYLLKLNDVDLTYPLAIRFSPMPSDLAEFNILTRSEFQHPGLLTALSVFQIKKGSLDLYVEDGSLCVVMPCALGDTLEKEIIVPRMPKALTKERFDTLIQWFKEIVAGVVVLHENGYVHGDLKPSNILFLNKGPSDPAVADFGVSAECPPEGFVSKAVVGTPGYRPPEMFKELKYSEKMDSFALGVILFEMLAGERLFHGHPYFDRWGLETPTGITDFLKSLEPLREGKKIKAWEDSINRVISVREEPPAQDVLDEAYFFIRECLLGTLPVLNMFQYRLLGGGTSAIPEAPAALAPTLPADRHLKLTPLGEMPGSSTAVVPAQPSREPKVPVKPPGRKKSVAPHRKK